MVTDKTDITRGYISNPFIVFINSFKAALGININTLLWLIGVTVLSFLAGFLVFATAGILAGDSESAAPLVVLILLLPAVIWATVLSVAFLKYAIMTARQQQVSFPQVLQVGWQKAAGTFGLAVVMALIIIIGLVLLIIPGLVALYWLLFAPYIYIDQDVGIGEAMRRSRQLVQGKLAEIGGLVGAGLIFGIPSWIPFIGNLYDLVFTPVTQIAWSYRYISALELANNKQPKPPTDPVNYWVVAIAIGLPALVILFAGIILIVSALSSR